MDMGQQVTKGGIIIPDDDMKDRGIKPRWAQVYRIGEGIDWLKEGDYVLMEHGRWSPGFELDDGNEKFDVRLADPNGILGVSDTRPEEAEIGRL